MNCGHRGFSFTSSAFCFRVLQRGSIRQTRGSQRDLQVAWAVQLSIRLGPMAQSQLPLNFIPRVNVLHLFLVSVFKKKLKLAWHVIWCSHPVRQLTSLNITSQCHIKYGIFYRIISITSAVSCRSPVSIISALQEGFEDIQAQSPI